MADGVHVLLVEDDPVDAQLLRASLHASDMGSHQIERAASLAAARTRLSQKPTPDVVLLDLGLPDSRGLETFEQLLAANERVPVVVLTGLDDDSLASAAVEAGAQDYLVKGSVTGEVMMRVVRHAIDRHRLQVALRARVREQASLFAISQSLHVAQSASELCAEVAGHLCRAMTVPVDCHATVAIDDAHGSAGTAPTVDLPLLEAAVSVGGATRGRLTVGYSRPDGEDLHPEQQQLLHAAADAIAGWLARRDALQQMAKDEERLRILVSQLPGLAWTTDGELRVTTVVGAALASLGIDAEELVGTPIVELFAPDPSDDSPGAFEDALSGDAVVVERQWRGLWWRVLVEPQRDAEHRIIGTVVLTLDITVERQQRVALDESQERFAGLWASATDAMILADDAGDYIAANPAACDLTGYDEHELQSLHAWDLASGLFGVDSETALATWQQFITGGALAGEFPIRRKDGTTVHTDFRAVANIVPGVHLFTLRDITDRKQSEAALAASDIRFRAIAESSQDAIYRVRLEPDLAIEYVNAAAEAITGFSRQAIADTPMLMRQRVHPDDASAIDMSWSGSDAAGVQAFRFQHSDGRWIWLEDRRSIVLDNGRPVGVQGVIRDVTARANTEQSLRNSLVAEQQAAEQLRATDALKSSFLRAVSHELRTPLTSILGYATTLDAHAGRFSTEQLADFHHRLVVNATRLERLLSDLLDVERLNHGVVRLDLLATDLTRLARTVSRTINFGGRELVIDDTPAIAMVDAHKVERIIHNLLANAVKHTPTGSTIWVACEATDEAGVITVSDNGPGVAEADHERAFEAFWQGPAMQDASSPGTGIGLSLVRQFATLHGGDVRLDDRPGGGARFRVSLSVTAPIELDRAVPDELFVYRTYVGARTDEGSFRELMQETVEQIQAVTSAEEATGLVLAWIRQVGAQLVQPDPEDGRILGIDLSIGTQQQLKASAPVGTPARHRLENHLPFLLQQARLRCPDAQGLDDDHADHGPLTTDR